MFNFIFVSMIVLCYSTMPGNGQRTISSCKDSNSDADENFMENLRVFEEKSNLMHESLYLQLQTVNNNIERKFQTMYKMFNSLRNEDPCGANADLCDCSTIRANGYTGNGVYRVYINHQNERHYATAFCDMTTGWTVFQRRKDGSVDFYRGWNDYANGFGNPNGEYWLGNDFLHMLTSKRRYRLRIDLEDFEGGKRFAEYSTFIISSAADKYRLTIRNYSGNAGDSLASWHNNRQFSTKDQDNDAFKRNCPVRDRGAWWYSSCHESNLNGIYYLNGSYSCSSCVGGDGIVWEHWLGERYSLKSTEMKISFY